MYSLNKNAYLPMYRSKYHEIWCRCKNLSFIWLLDCYQILILSPLLHAENSCTIVDKIYSKTEASLIQFSWNLYSILYHKSRVCIPNFKWIQIDLITQTWLRSQLTQILQYRTDFNHLSYTSSNMNQTWNQLVWILSQDINPFNLLINYLLKVILWIYPTQIIPNLITNQLIHSIIS